MVVMHGGVSCPVVSLVVYLEVEGWALCRMVSHDIKGRFHAW